MQVHRNKAQSQPSVNQLTDIQQSISVFLESIGSKDFNGVSEADIEEFGENCKNALRKCLLATRDEEPFKLRMSNIGKPLRSLLLEKLFGRPPLTPEMRLRMTYGYIWESFIFFLLKAAGLNLETDKKVKLDVAVDDKTYTLFGSLDVKIDGKIYDIKSASPWSFDNKFTNFANMQTDDPFGYVGQGLAYSLADKSKFGGWIVADKSDGRIKVVEVPQDNYRELAVKYLTDFKDKFRAVMSTTKLEELPPCSGVVEETFGKSKTGNLILNKSCEFCDHKFKCHPNLQYLEDVNSKAQRKTWKYYVKLLKPND